MGTEKRARQKANRQARLQAAVEARQRAKRKTQYLRIGVVAVLVVAVIGGFAMWPRGDSEDLETSASSTSTTGSSTPADGSTSTVTPPGAFAYGSGACPPATVEAATKTFAAAPMQCIDPAKTYTAVFDTSAGTVKAKLDTSRTPGTTNNFVVLSRYRYYDATKLFRTNTGIGIIQGGGTAMTDSPGYTIPDEGGTFTYAPGDLVMARADEPDSAGGQFFFAVNDKTAELDEKGTFVTFGKVTEGQDVLDRILASNKATSSVQPDEGAPDPPVTVNSIRIEES